MKIAMFIPNITGSCGRPAVALSLIKGLRKNNITTYLITNPESDSKLLNSLKLVSLFIPCNPESKSIYRLLVSIVRLKKFLRENNIDIIHTHHRYAEFISNITRIIFNINVKIITTAHSLTTNLNRISYKSDLIIAVSSYLANHLIDHYDKDAGKIIVIHNGVDKEDAIESKDFIQNEKYLLGIGRFEHEKGFDILLDAIALLNSNKINLKLILVGHGSQEPELKKKIEDYSLDVSIHNAETTPWALIKNASMVIIPSRIETFGLAIIEAGLLTKCVIASDIGGIPEIIDDNVNGLLFQNENYSELAELIRRTINNDDLMNRLGNALRKKVEECFSFDKMVHKYIEVYQDILR